MISPAASLHGQTRDGPVTALADPSVSLAAAPAVACLLPLDDAADLALRLGDSIDVRAFADRRALLTHVREHPVAAVVIALRDALDRPTTGTVRALRVTAPALIVFARCRPIEADCRALLEFARAGGTDVLLRGGGLEPLRRLLVAPPAADAARLVAQLVGAGVPDALASALTFMFAHLDASDPAEVLDGAARALGTSRRAFERRLALARLPAPRRLLSWCRLLAAADRLSGDAVAVERVAHDVGFASANALRNALHRYAGTTPSAVRDGDGTARLVERLCGRVAPGDARAARVTARRVAEVATFGVARCEATAVDLEGARARLLECLTRRLVGRAVAPNEGCRAECASAPRDGPIVSPRSTPRTSAARRSGQDRTVGKERERC